MKRPIDRARVELARSRGARLAVTLLAVVLAGCGYALTHASEGPRRKVAVQVVDNRTFRQRIEIPLTRRILEQLPVLGAFAPAARDQADAELRVEIVDIEGQTLAGAGRTPVREGALDFAVRVRLVDLQSGKTLTERKLIDRAEFRVAVGETEATATEEAAYDLARKIVLALDEDF